MFFIGCSTHPSYKMVSIQISKMSFYMDFQRIGYTTASALTHFDELVKKEIGFLKVQQQDYEKLEQIMIKTPPSKFIQTKLGQNLCFVIAEINGAVCKLVISDSLIIDYTNLVYYWIKNKSDIDELSRLISRYKE